MLDAIDSLDSLRWASHERKILELWLPTRAESDSSSYADQLCLLSGWSRRSTKQCERGTVDPAFSNLYFDISWTEVAKYLVASPESTKIAPFCSAAIRDGFCSGQIRWRQRTRSNTSRSIRSIGPLRKMLTPQASELVRKGNYERLFDEA